MKRFNYKIIIVFTLIFCFLFSSFAFAAGQSSDVADSLLNSFPIDCDENYFVDKYPALYSYNDNLEDIVQGAFDYGGSIQSAFSYDMDYSYACLFINDMLWIYFWDPERVSYAELDYVAGDNYNHASVEVCFLADNMKIDSNKNIPFMQGGVIVVEYKSLWNELEYSFTTCYAPGMSFSFPLMYSKDFLNNGELTQLNGDKSWWSYYAYALHHGDNIKFPYFETGKEIFMFPLSPSDIIPDVNFGVGDSSYLHQIEDPDTLGLAGYVSSGMSGMLSKISGMFSNLTDSLKDMFDGLENSFVSAIDGIKNTIEDFFSNFEPFFTMMNEFYSYGILPDGSFNLILMLETIFIPDQDYIDAKTEEFYTTNFFWINSIFNSVNSLFGMLERAALSSAVPEIIIPAGTYGHFVLENDIVWSFSWYLPFKAVADLVIAAFIYLCFFYRLVTSVPNILSGVGSPFVRGTIAFEKSAVKKANIASSRRKGG